MQRSRGTQAWKRIGLAAGLAVVAGCLMGTSPALADSVTLDVTTTAGESDPAADIARVFTLSGTSAAPKKVYAKYRRPGGAPCAPSAATDSGEILQVDYNSFWSISVNGSFSIARAATWDNPGTWVFCYWLSENVDAISSPFTQTITFRAPSGTITATVNPVTPSINQTATVTVSGTTEAPAYVYAAVRPAGGAPCAPTYAADSGTGLISGRSVNGAFSVTETMTQSTAGDYVLCLWLAQSTTDTAPSAGPQPQPFTVLGPKPVVVKTKVPTSTTLRRRGARYSGRISTSANCIAGRTVVLRRVGSGVKSFGRALTRADGTFTVKRGIRLHGRVYVVIVARSQGNTTCSSGRALTIRG